MAEIELNTLIPAISGYAVAPEQPGDRVFAENLHRDIKLHLAQTNSDAESSQNSSATQQNYDANRPAELRDGFFDGLWANENIRQLDWSQFTETARNHFARWYRQGMPPSNEFAPNPGRLVFKIIKAAGFDDRGKARVTLWMTLPEDARRPAEFQARQVNKYWKIDFIRNFNWITVSGDQRRYFADWLIEKMPETSGMTHAELRYLREVAQALGYDYLPHLRRVLRTHIGSDQYWRPPELAGKEFDSLWENNIIRDYNWAEASSGRRKAFAKWLHGMPPLRKGVDSSHYVTEMAAELGFNTGVAEMRTELWPYIPAEWRRPEELQAPVFDAVWSLPPVQNVNWVFTVKGEKTVAASFAEWLRKSMGRSLSEIHAKHLLRVAEEMGLDSVTAMGKKISEWLYTSKGKGLQSAIEEFQTRPMQVLLTHPLFQYFDWSTLTTTEERNIFVDWINKGMPDVQQKTTPQFKALKQLAALFGLESISLMGRELDAYFEAQAKRPAQFTGKVFDVLWENLNFRFATDWVAVNAETLKDFKAWVHQGVPGEDTLKSINNAKLIKIKKIAEDIGFSDIEPMSRLVLEPLSQELNWPAEFTGQAFESLKQSEWFRKRGWVWEFVPTGHIRVFVQWANTGMPDEVNIKNQKTLAALNAVTSRLDAKNISQLKQLMQSASEAFLAIKNAKPAWLTGKAFDVLWQQAEFRVQADWHNLESVTAANFVNWVRLGAPDKRRLNNISPEEVSVVESVAKELGFSSIYAMHKMIFDLLSNAPEWPAEFTGPVFDILKASDRFQGHGWIWQFVAPDHVQVFADWVQNGMPDEGVIDDPHALAIVTGVAQKLAYETFNGMRSGPNNLSKNVPLGLRYKENVEVLKFVTNGVSLGRKWVIKQQLSDLSKSYQLEIPVKAMPLLQALLKHKNLFSAANDLGLDHTDYKQQLDVLLENIRRDPQQFSLISDFRDFALARMELGSLMVWLADHHGKEYLSDKEVDALTAAYRFGKTPEQQVDAWKYTPLKPEEYDSFLQSGLAKLGWSLKEFFAEVDISVARIKDSDFYTLVLRTLRKQNQAEQLELIRSAMRAETPADETDEADLQDSSGDPEAASVGTDANQTTDSLTAPAPNQTTQPDDNPIVKQFGTDDDSTVSTQLPGGSSGPDNQSGYTHLNVNGFESDENKYGGFSAKPTVTLPQNLVESFQQNNQPQSDNAYEVLPAAIRSALTAERYAQLDLNADDIQTRFNRFQNLHPNVRANIQFNDFVGWDDPIINQLERNSAHETRHDAEINYHKQRTVTARQLADSQNQLAQAQQKHTEAIEAARAANSQRPGFFAEPIQSTAPPAHWLGDQTQVLPGNTQNNIVSANFGKTGDFIPQHTIEPLVPMVTLSGKTGSLVKQYQDQTSSIPRYLYLNTAGQLQLHAVVEKGSQLDTVAIPMHIHKAPINASVTAYTNQGWTGLPQLSELQKNAVDAHIRIQQTNIVPVMPAPAVPAPSLSAPVNLPVLP